MNISRNIFTVDTNLHKYLTCKVIGFRVGGHNRELEIL
ncbi:Uncharacterised protein [Rothia aeria]|uniref:Uncharacterized protein n=1 Tax=Rothia aeria TaxID=172042 RepID=A0A7Z9A1M2_9MICC|nr:Uncharacterised protein [Rothia aeria]